MGNSMVRNAAWKAFEWHVAKLLGLDPTISSGSKFYDQGDAVSRGRQDPFPLYADAKTTEKGSFSLKAKELIDWTEQAQAVGKRFLLPLRFTKVPEADDYVLMRLEDFKELLDMAKGRVAPSYKSYQYLPVEEWPDHWAAFDGGTYTDRMVGRKKVVAISYSPEPGRVMHGRGSTSAEAYADLRNQLGFKG
jgi:hypothetical protein